VGSEMCIRDRQMLVLNLDMEQSSSVFQQEIVYTPGVKMAAIVVSALPMMVIYPFLQKYFNKGLMLGSVKG